MNQSATALKALMLDMLEQICHQPGSDISATQQMGVNLTNAVKREGVVIIQNQNVEVLYHIIPRITQAIRLCDSMVLNVSAIAPPEPLQIEVQTEKDPIRACCSYLFDRGTTWESMQSLLKQRYLAFIMDQFKTKVEAASFLGIGGPYLSKLTAEKEGVP